MKKRGIKPLSDRFWSKVKKTKYCWVWTASKINGGYGSIQKGKSGEGTICAHRLSWIIHYGKIENNLWVLHRCDNRSCVRPDHLFLGTYRDNIEDMASKGRKPIGSMCSYAKLNEKDVVIIRKLLNKKVNHLVIAMKFGVSRKAIYDIFSGKNWKHV